VEKKKIIYSFGECKSCGKVKTLKSGYCVECAKKLDFPDIFNDLLGGFRDVR